MKVENNLLSKYFFIFLEFFSRLSRSPLNKSIAISSSVLFPKRKFLSRFALEIIFGNRFMLENILGDQIVSEKYLTTLDQITTSKYIDSVINIMRPKIDNYMAILKLDYPQFKIEDETKRLKENAEYLRKVYLYPKDPFNAYLSDDNKQNKLILVNRKPVPIKIIELIFLYGKNYINNWNYRTRRLLSI